MWRRLVARLLAKDPADRFAVPGEVADALTPEPPEPAELPAAPPEKNGAVLPPERDLAPLAKSNPAADQRRWRRLVTVGTAALAGGLCLLVLLLFRPGPPEVTPKTGRDNPLHPGTLGTVQANRPWQDTGIDVQAGEPITLFASGWWRGGPRKSGCSPNGDKNQPVDRNLIADANAMALVGWVAGEGAPFVIGVRKIHEPTVNGRLFVQANDVDTKDNSGHVQLQVKGGDANESPAALWQVGYGQFDPGTKRVKSFQVLPYWPKAVRWQPGPEAPFNPFGFLGLQSDGLGHPGPNQQFALIRRWVVPRDGVVAISGSLTHPQNAGDGVRARLVSSRLGNLAPPWIVRNGKADTKVERVEIKRGDTIDAVVDCHGNQDADAFSWPLDVKVLEWHPDDKK